MQEKLGFFRQFFSAKGLLSTTLSFLALSLVHSVIRRLKEADFNFRMQKEGDDDTSLTIQLRKSSGEERGNKKGGEMRKPGVFDGRAFPGFLGQSINSLIPENVLSLSFLVLFTFLSFCPVTLPWNYVAFSRERERKRGALLRAVDAAKPAALSGAN